MDFNRENFDHLLETHGALSSENEQLKTDNKHLKERIQYLLRKLFGRSSEKLSPDQMATYGYITAPGSAYCLNGSPAGAIRVWTRC